MNYNKGRKMLTLCILGFICVGAGGVLMWLGTITFNKAYNEWKGFDDNIIIITKKPGENKNFKEELLSPNSYQDSEKRLKETGSFGEYDIKKKEDFKSQLNF